MKPPEDRHSKMVGIRLTPAARLALQRVCERLKTTPTELVRSLVSRLDKRPDIQRIEDVA